MDTSPSLATKPDSVAATGLQSPNPRGAKIGAKKPPIAAIREYSASTNPKVPLCTPKDAKNHITAQQRKRIVPAFLMNAQTRSHTCMRRVFTAGR